MCQKKREISFDDLSVSRLFSLKDIDGHAKQCRVESRSMFEFRKSSALDHRVTE